VRALDSNGLTKVLDVHGGRLEASNDIVSCASEATAIADTAKGWAINAGPSQDEENTGYGSGTVSVFQNLTAM